MAVDPGRAALLGVIALAGVGFVAGTARWSYDLDDTEATASTDEERAEALSYTELRATPRGAGSGWDEGVAVLRAGEPGILDEVDLSGTVLDEALDERAALRAFDGAPPSIPHAIDQLAAPSCLACHDDGARFEGRIARPMSHVELPSCTQCHVTQEDAIEGEEALAVDPRAVENGFVGMASPVRGPRANPIAPPQVPHRYFMRERCESCHGVNGRDAIRSTHPWRQSCSQCHTTRADVDGRPGGVAQR